MKCDPSEVVNLLIEIPNVASKFLLSALFEVYFSDYATCLIISVRTTVDAS